MRPPSCTDADDLLHCSATLGNLGEREERARHPYLGKALGSLASAKDRSKHTGPPFSSAQHGSIHSRQRTALFPTIAITMQDVWCIVCMLIHISH